MDDKAYNLAMKAMDSCASIQRPKLKSHLRAKLELSSQEADELVDEYRAIKDACNDLTSDVFSKELSSTLFDSQIFSRYPRLSDELRKRWLNESMHAQFR